MLEIIENAIDRYLDTHRENIRGHVDKNLEATKGSIIEHLPEHVIKFLTHHFEKKREERGGSGHFVETLLTTMTTVVKDMSQEFKDEIRKAARHHVDKATEGTTDFITDTAVKESKVAVRAITHKEKEEKKHHFFKSLDLSFLVDGKVGIVNKILELIRPPIHRVNEDISEKISNSFPQKIKALMLKEFGGGILSSNDKDGDGIHDGLQGVLAILGGGGGGGRGAEGGSEHGDIFDRILAHLPAKIQEFLGPFLAKFEDGLMENLSGELHNRIFGEDNFKKGVRGFLKGHEEESSEHGHGGGLLGEVVSMFKKRDDD
ncbi:14649_t:CDS:1 [Ambispora leptoticha]|uniref:14649_t:CDS:1 n=1 Tax=Ambispora leptoticha TaxID=144679 RepID=A0A9N9FP95_9GLOM|nr:14649_t:CDS:1 [Ambispora leptoticha]